MVQMQDKTLTCSDCGQQFTFTASEQEFFAQKGFNDPSRCPSCRAARKAARNSGESFGGGSRGERQMSPAALRDPIQERLAPARQLTELVSVVTLSLFTQRRS